MLPIVLVLFLAHSAFGAPSVAVSQVGINEIAPQSWNGKPVSSYTTDRSFELVDGGDTNIYILTIQQILNDMANQPDPWSQALALSQTIAVLGELATGVPGDSCVEANAINAWAYAKTTGNNAGVRSAVSELLSRYATYVDLIVNLANNPGSQRFAVGPRSGCAGGGRTYQFESAWDFILGQAGPYQIALVNEEYCAAKRLYTAFNSRSNNVGAAVTAASIEPVVEVFKQILPTAASFLNAVASGANGSAQASQLKSAIARATINC